MKLSLFQIPQYDLLEATEVILC